MEPLKSFFRRNEGQSLVEILVGLAIGALLIGTATIGIVFVLRSSTTNQNLGAGTNLTKGLLDNVQNFAASNWSSLYGLSHGASSTYFIVASGTNLSAVPGAEGVLGNDVPNGLVGHWGLDEGTGTVTYDESGNGDNGNLVNGPAWMASSACKSGNCLNFSSSSVSYVALPSAAVLNPTSSISVAAWVKSNFVTGYPGTWQLVSNYNAYILGTASLGTNSVCFIVYNGTTWGYGNCTPAIATPNQWHFFVGTYDSATSQENMYLDGTLVKTVSFSGAISNGGALDIGHRECCTENFDGLMDDVRVYNRTLTSAEVEQMYNSQGFSRYFYVQDVCRTNDASSSISGNPPCSGYDDPLTQQVTAVTQWLAGAATDNVSFSTYLTNYQNFTLRQSDWSGGSGQTGPLTIPNTQYASGTNVTGTSTLGSFQIQNLTQQ